MITEILKSGFYRETFAYLDDLSERERAWALAFLDEMARTLEQNAAAVTPMTILRMDSVIQEYLAVRALMAAPAEVPPTVVSDPEAKPGARAKAPAVALSEAIGKARERLRKAVSELEDSMGTTKARGLGLADSLRPIVTGAKGALEEALAFGAKKPQSDRDSASNY